MPPIEFHAIPSSQVWNANQRDAYDLYDLCYTNDGCNDVACNLDWYGFHDTNCSSVPPDEDNSATLGERVVDALVGHLTLWLLVLAGLGVVASDALARRRHAARTAAYNAAVKSKKLNVAGQ